MNRRQFVGSCVSASAVSAGILGQTTPGPSQARPFRLKYAPHFGMFRHHAGEDLLDQLRFVADQGFRAFEDNGMKGRPASEQERIAREMQRLNLEMGVFVASADFGEVTFASDKPDVREKLLADIRESVEVAGRVNARWCTVVLGCYDTGLEWDYQTVRVIDNLKRCCDIVEPAGLTMVLEPLNPWRDHPGLFLTKIPQAYMICQSVGSGSCKILFDIYHQQITEGNLIPNMDRAWTEVGYIQIGDNPGRKEPTTGEINYLNVFKHISGKEYDGILGMEHGNSKPGLEGEKALLEAYRYCDSF